MLVGALELLALAELGSVVQTEEGVTPLTPSPKRSRKKKVADEAGSRLEIEIQTSSESSDSALQVSTEADVGSAPVKPKRTRRVGEPKPKHGEGPTLVEERKVIVENLSGYMDNSDLREVSPGYTQKIRVYPELTSLSNHD